MTVSRNHDVDRSRRRFIAIAAAAAGSGFLPRLSLAQDTPTFTWRGVALGADATLTLQHDDEAEAKSAIAACLSEVARLEDIFSLHRAESALSRLNREGRIDDAPMELRALVAEALALAARTDGAFDPTIQPLWSLYHRHFSDRNTDPAGPKEAEIEHALALTGWRNVSILAGSIIFEKRGMALTLNGIAQGYITDKVGELLRARGFEHVLINMGEQLALGAKRDRGAWKVGIANPVQPSSILEELPLAGGALATSGGYGYSFDRGKRFPHILDPRTGAPVQQVGSVTVATARATLADGLSTALSVAPMNSWPAILGSAARAYVIPLSGSDGYWL
jgi:thiamine biosynthesis lipoprotein